MVLQQGFILKLRKEMVVKKINLLLVDDERSFTHMLKLNLENSGKYKVYIENDPCEAIATALKVKPNLILLDVIMPSIEGPDIAIEAQKYDVLNETPIIFLTATVTREEVLQQNGRIGGHPFVAKPSNLHELLSSIETNLIPRG